MLNMNIEEYDSITRAQALDWYDWGYDVMEGSPVLVSDTTDNKVFLAKDTEGEWCCEIEGWETVEGDPRPHWNMLASAYNADEPEDALALAITELANGTDVLHEEGNSEDAVNVCAYNAYQLAYGDTPMMEMEPAKMDGMLKAARAYVKSNCRFAGFEWEEF